MSVSATAHVPTTNGSRYLQQLCKHWAHNLAVEYDTARGKVTFPAEGRSGSWSEPGVLSLEAGVDTLTCRIDAGEEAQLSVLVAVVARHLDRFAFREAPLAFDWQPTA